MYQDPFVEAVDEVTAAGRVACDAIAATIRPLEHAAHEREHGVPLVDIVDELIGAGGRELRLASAEAFHEFERAIGEMRARVVCALIEQDGLSFTDVGARLLISRQAVARLYRQAKGDEGLAAM